MPGEKLVKIVFGLYSEIFEQDMTEILDAAVTDQEKGYFKIESVPLFSPRIASGDIIWAECDDKIGMLTYRETVRASGNSTVHCVVLDDEYDVEAIRRLFEEMGCRSDNSNSYFALDIPAAINYVPIKRRLDELEKEDIIDYQESCLSGRHEYRNISFG
jgi:hypothetical protein